MTSISLQHSVVYNLERIVENSVYASDAKKAYDEQVKEEKYAFPLCIISAVVVIAEGVFLLLMYENPCPDIWWSAYGINFSTTVCCIAGPALLVGSIIFKYISWSDEKAVNHDESEMYERIIKFINSQFDKRSQFVLRSVTPSSDITALEKKYDQIDCNDGNSTTDQESTDMIHTINRIKRAAKKEWDGAPKTPYWEKFIKACQIYSNGIKDHVVVREGKIHHPEFNEILAK